MEGLDLLVKSPGYSIFVAALIPTAVGFLWYGKLLFGNAWMRYSGMTEEKAASANMPLIMGLSYVFAVLISVLLFTIVNHEYGLQSLLAVPSANGGGFVEGAQDIVNSVGAEHIKSWRTFGHGAIHGGMLGFIATLCISGTNALFEQRPFKLVWIHVGYWTVTLALMGGLLCAWTA